MPSTENHPSFPLTIGRNQKIWRYMDFTKFIHFMMNKSLWLNRSDRFDDVFEGRWPKPNLDHMRSSSMRPIETLTEHMRQFTYINCWYISDFESAAMWKLYAQTNEAIAIQTTYERLHALMPESCFIGEVTYIDYATQAINVSNAFNVHMHKRIAFSHERELRAIIQDMGTPTKKNADGTSVHDYNIVNSESGMSISLEPTNLVESIAVAPSSSAWFRKLVEQIAASNGFSENQIVTSGLDVRPY